MSLIRPTKLIVIFFALTTWVGQHLSAEESLFLDESGELKSLATDFAQCSGVFKAYSEYLKPTNPATAENLSGIKRGAEYSAMYLLTEIKMAKDKKPRVYGDAKPHVESIAYGAYTKTASLIELNDIDNANIALQKCISLNEIQANIVEQMRAVIYD